MDVGTHLAGKYHIVETLEPRPYGNLYIVTDSVANRRWVLRQFTMPEGEKERQEFLTHFYSEGERQSSLIYVQLPRVQEFFIERGFAWTVRELIKGQTVQDYLARNPEPLAPEVAKRWMLAVARALRVLHTQDPPLFLGGFGPEELLITEGKMRLVDFGRLRLFPPSLFAKLEDPFLPEWIAPEIRKELATSRQADIWSLGALGYHLLTRADPSATDRQPMAALRADLAPELIALIDTCMMGTQERFNTVEEVGDRLMGRTASSAVTATTDEEKARPAPARTSRVPKLDVEPGELLFDQVKPGSVGVEILQVFNLGGGALAGEIQADMPWIQFMPRHFQGNDEEIRVWLDPNLMPEEGSVQGTLRVTTPQEERAIPVRVNMLPPAIAKVPTAVLLLVLLLLAVAPAAGLSYFTGAAFNEVVSVYRADPHQVDLLSNPALKNALVVLKAAVPAGLLLALLGPVLVWLFYRILPPSRQRRLKLIQAVCLFTPSIAWLILTRAAQETVMEGGVLYKVLSQQPPLSISFPFFIVNMVTAALILAPPSRYPGQMGSNLAMRAVVIIMLLALYAHVFWRYVFV